MLHELCDQDYIHNHKKLLNPLDHATRVLTMGPYLVHMNHLKLFHYVFPLDEYGLGSSDRVSGQTELGLCAETFLS